MQFKNTLSVLLLGLLFQIPNFGFAQEITPLDIALRYLEKNKENLNLTAEDISDYQVSDYYASKHNGVTHVYLNQQFQGIEVNAGIININVLQNGEVLNMGNRFISDLSKKINTPTPAVTPEGAVQKVVDFFKIRKQGDIVLKSKTDDRHFIFEPTGLALEPIPVELVFEKTDEKTVRLAWRVRLYQQDAQHWYNARIDAQTGEMLNHHDQMLHCSFDNSTENCEEHGHDHHFVKNEIAPSKPADNMLRANSYHVYPMPVQSPTFGSRALVTDPANVTASPFGWHDTDGAPGAEFTITRGNNVHAYHDIFDLNGSIGDEPDGGATHDFDFPLDLSTGRPYTQVAPAVTNLFYWSNIIHDLWYQYGFDEVAGNFQVNNYDKGGEEGDYVRAEALDGSRTNNAVFGTDQDGSGARMQMFIWTDDDLPDPPPTPDLMVAAPDTVAGREFDMVPGGFGGALPFPGITAKVVLASDSTGVHSDLCEDITNATELAGNIAMIDRGDCQFGAKMLKAEEAGAIAVIMCNNVNEQPIPMGPGLVGDQVTIPGIMISMNDCIELKMHLSDLEVTLSGPELILPDPGPRGIDGDLDNGIIAHEYGHGLSIRMTGGPSRGNCLNSQEQAGEGWSDWFAMVMTTDKDNTAEERRGLATYAVEQPTSGRGLREFPYSRDIGVNPDTYRQVAGEDSPHRVGSVWCAMIWDLFWNLVDEYDFDEDMYDGNGGNNMAMQLVIDGIKLQPCNPDFLDSRDAILAADEALYGGENKCLIWRTFARRGLGFSATSGGNEAFDLPPACEMSSAADLVDDLGISVLPNPTDGIFTVKMNASVENEVSVRLTNIAGSLIFDKEMNPAESGFQFDLSSYQAGIYLLQIQTKEVSVVRKIVVN